MQRIFALMVLALGVQAPGLSGSAIDSTLSVTDASLRVSRKSLTQTKRQSHSQVIQRDPQTTEAGRCQQGSIQSSYDRDKNVTTVASPLSRISGDKDRYHSVDFSISCRYAGQTKRLPDHVDFELVSVVKARRLNSDLYVVFRLDGKEMHFGSSRSAIFNPVPGRLWIGERMIFSIPYDDFKKFAEADQVGVKLGGITFKFSEACRDTIREFARVIDNPETR
jgi:hypothetical protein